MSIIEVQGGSSAGGATGPTGPTGPSGSAGATGPTGAGVTMMPNLVAPYDPRLVVGVGPWLTSTVLLVRVTVPKTGTLHDVTVFVQTQSGNLAGGVYDTGDATAGVYTSLWASGSVAVGGANAWQVIGDPAVSVTAGRQLYLSLMVDNTTAKFGALPASGYGVNQLPANFWPAAGGASPVLWGWGNGTALTMPATITDPGAGYSTGTLPIFLMARVA